MEKSIAMVLEQLSSKLGTTVEHLWGVLVKQVQVDAILNIFYVLFVVASGIVLYILHSKFRKETKEEDDYKAHDLYYRHDAYGHVMIISAAIWAMLAIIMMFGSIPSIVTAFTNPEYAALKDILGMLRP